MVRLDFERPHHTLAAEVREMEQESGYVQCCGQQLRLPPFFLPPVPPLPLLFSPGVRLRAGGCLLLRLQRFLLRELMIDAQANCQPDEV